jgi:hypothetical protein
MVDFREIYFRKLILPFILMVGCTTTQDAKHSGLVMKSGSKTCYVITPENRLRQVSVCEDKQYFEFNIGDKSRKYDYKNYLKDLRATIVSYMEWTSYSAENLRRSTTDLWISCHWQITDQCQIVAVVKSPGSNFSFHLPIEPEHWQGRPIDHLWLGNSEYPSTKTQRLGVLWVRAKPGFSDATLNQFMKETGVYSAHGKKSNTLVNEVQGHWPNLMLRVEPFSEGKITSHIKAHIDAPIFLDEISLVPAMDVQGPKAKFSQFNF